MSPHAGCGQYAPRWGWPLEYVDTWHPHTPIIHEVVSSTQTGMQRVAGLHDVQRTGVHAASRGSSSTRGGLAFQCRLSVQNSHICMPQVQHSLVAGRRHTSHVTTSCKGGPGQRAASTSGGHAKWLGPASIPCLPGRRMYVPAASRPQWLSSRMGGKAGKGAGKLFGTVRQWR